MPACKKCNSNFRIRNLINGKVRYLIKRKYCLDCSPFGSGNSKKINRSELVSEENIGTKIKCVCSRCSRLYEFDRKKRNGHRPDTCNSCNSNSKRTEAKKKLVELGGGGCQGCGYQRSLRALVFHHIDPAQKDFSLSSISLGKKEKIMAELSKCVLLCANCHAEVHEGIRRLDPLSASGRLPGSDPGNGCSNQPEGTVTVV